MVFSNAHKQWGNKIVEIDETSSCNRARQDLIPIVCHDPIFLTAGGITIGDYITGLALQLCLQVIRQGNINTLMAGEHNPAPTRSVTEFGYTKQSIRPDRCTGIDPVCLLYTSRCV